MKDSAHAETSAMASSHELTGLNRVTLRQCAVPDHAGFNQFTMPLPPPKKISRRVKYLGCGVPRFQETKKIETLYQTFFCFLIFEGKSLSCYWRRSTNSRSRKALSRYYASECLLLADAESDNPSDKGKREREDSGTRESRYPSSLWRVANREGHPKNGREMYPRPIHVRMACRANQPFGAHRAQL